MLINWKRKEGYNMLSWDIKPTESINGISFGENRKRVREAINLEYKEFKKNAFSKNTTDNYGFCHVYYDENDNLVAVEFFDDIELTINNMRILPGKTSEIKSIIDDLEFDGYGYISNKYSVGISETDGNIESILFGKKNYYN